MMYMDSEHTPPATPQADGADAINHEHRLVRSGADALFAHAIRCGELLAAKKIEVGHGHFTAWVAAHCEFSERTAQVYMQTADQNRRGLRFSSLNQLLQHERAAAALTATAPTKPVAEAVAQPPAEKTLSRKRPRAERIAEISRLMSDGYNPLQMAEEMEIHVKTVREIAHDAGIKLPTVKTPRISAQRVIAETVDGIANYVQGLALLPPTLDVHSTQVAEWIESLDTSLKAIKQLRKQLQELC